MDLYNGWTQVPVRGQYYGSNGVPKVGYVTFLASQTIIANDAVVIPSTIKVQLDANGAIPAGFTLPATDDPDINPIGWTYLVTEAVPGGRAPYSIAVSVNDLVDGVDLPTVQPMVPPAEQVPNLQGLSVAAGDARYVKLSSVNQPSGVLGLDSTAMAPDTNLPEPLVDYTTAFENSLA